MSRDVEILLHGAKFRSVLKSKGVTAQITSLTDRACARAEALSGLRFGHGVDRGPVSVHGWVGARVPRNRKTGAVIMRVYEKQVAALSQALHGI